MSARSLSLAFLLAIGLAGPAFADSTVKVELWNKGGMMRGAGPQFGMGMHANRRMAMMGIEIDKSTVPAGKITFDVRNISKDMIHEMLVVPVKDENATLPYIAGENRVDEEAAGDLGEVADLDAGKSGSLTLDLKPGIYVLFCNIPGHFMAGMWTTLTVK